MRLTGLLPTPTSALTPTSMTPARYQMACMSLAETRLTRNECWEEHHRTYQRCRGLLNRVAKKTTLALISVPSVAETRVLHIGNGCGNTVGYRELFPKPKLKILTLTHAYEMHACALMDVPLTGVRLVGVYLTGMHLIACIS
jgi:hypothetical protein